jgi:hypothetical protein
VRCSHGGLGRCDGSIAPFRMRSGAIYPSSVRHPLWYRALITLWAIWFTTALIEPAGFMACPMHSGMVAGLPAGMAHLGPVAAPLSHAGMTHDAMTHDAVAHDAMAQDVTDLAATDAPAPTHHDCCTCLGQCCTMAPAELSSPALALVLPATLQTMVARYEQTARLVARVEHALPFANGPPRTA